MGRKNVLFFSSKGAGRAGLPVDVCAYADEEGHWGNFIGSRSLMGDLSEDQLIRRAIDMTVQSCETRCLRLDWPAGRGCA